MDQLSNFNSRINDNDLKYTMINTLQYLENNGVGVSHKLLEIKKQIKRKIKRKIKKQIKRQVKRQVKNR